MAADRASLPHLRLDFAERERTKGKFKAALSGLFILIFVPIPSSHFSLRQGTSTLAGLPPCLKQSWQFVSTSGPSRRGKDTSTESSQY